MLLALLAPVLAADCRESLSVRSVRPNDGQADVPTDARVLVSLIGWGTTDEVAIRVVDDTGATVEGTTETWCYEHEGPHEVHCWTRLTPNGPLAVDTAHSVRVNSTDAWTGSGSLSYTTTFTTGSSAASATAAPPSLTLDERTEPSPESCGYAEPRKYILTLTAAETDAAGLAVFQLDHVFPDGSAETERVHTVHVFHNQADVDVKQYLEGVDTPSDCFQVTHEDAAGRQTPGPVACWGQDTGDADSGTQDTSGPDSGTTATVPTDSAGPDSGGADTGEPGDDAGCGCVTAAPAPAWLGLLTVLVLGRRSRRRPGKPHPGPLSQKFVGARLPSPRLAARSRLDVTRPHRPLEQTTSHGDGCAITSRNSETGDWPRSGGQIQVWSSARVSGGMNWTSIQIRSSPRRWIIAMSWAIDPSGSWSTSSITSPTSTGPTAASTNRAPVSCSSKAQASARAFSKTANRLGGGPGDQSGVTNRSSVTP